MNRESTTSAENQISADQIASTGFSTQRKGYSPSEVRAFLLRVGTRMSQLETSYQKVRLELEATRDEMRLTARPVSDTTESSVDQTSEKASEVIRIASDTARAIRVQAESQAEALIDRAQKAARRITEETTARVDDQLKEAELSAQDLLVRARRQADDVLRRADIQGEEILQRAKEEGRHIIVRAKEQRAGLIEEARIKVELLEREISDLETSRSSVLSVLTGASQMIERAQRSLDPDSSRRKMMSSVEEAFEFLHPKAALAESTLAHGLVEPRVAAAPGDADLSTDATGDMGYPTESPFDIDRGMGEVAEEPLGDSEEVETSDEAEHEEGFRVLSVGPAELRTLEPDEEEISSYLASVTALLGDADSGDVTELEVIVESERQGEVTIDAETGTNGELDSTSLELHQDDPEPDRVDPSGEVRDAGTESSNAPPVTALSSTRREPAEEKPRLTFPKPATPSTKSASRRQSTSKRRSTGDVPIAEQTVAAGIKVDNDTDSDSALVDDAVRLARLEGVFEKMKISREADEVEAHDILTKSNDTALGELIDLTSDAVPSSTFGGEFEGESVRLDPADRELILARDEAISTSTSQLVRRIKRQLQDEQNEILDTLRKGGFAAVGGLIDGLRAAASSSAGPLAPIIKVATEAGFVSNGDHVDEGLEVEEISNAVAIDLQGQIGGLSLTKVEGALARNSSGSEADQISAVTSVYRELRSGRVEELVEDLMVQAYSRGALAGAEGSSIRWISYDKGIPCPDCEDNALAGLIPAGEPFPTSHLSPLAHPGCRCLITAVRA